MNYLHGTCALCLLLIAYFTHITVKLAMNQIVFQFGKNVFSIFWLCFQFQRTSIVVGCVLLCTGLLNSNANRLKNSKIRIRIKRHTKHHTYTTEQEHFFFEVWLITIIAAQQQQQQLYRQPLKILINIRSKHWCVGITFVVVVVSVEKQWLGKIKTNSLVRYMKNYLRCKHQTRCTVCLQRKTLDNQARHNKCLLNDSAN